MTLERPVYGAIFTSSESCVAFDKLSEGALTRYFWLSNIAKHRTSFCLNDEEVEDEEERVKDIINSMNKTWHGGYASSVLVENRYDEVNNVYMGVFATLFMIIDNVLIGNARLVIAFSPYSRDCTRVAFDVFEHGFPREFFKYKDNFPTLGILHQAIKGFSGMKCTSVVTSFRELPWKKDLPRVKDFLEYAKYNGYHLLGSNDRNDLASIIRLRTVCARHRYGDAQSRSVSRKRPRKSVDT